VYLDVASMEWWCQNKMYGATDLQVFEWSIAGDEALKPSNFTA